MTTARLLDDPELRRLTKKHIAEASLPHRPVRVTDGDDDSLRRLLRTYRRSVEDAIEYGRSTRADELVIRCIRTEQLARFCLRMRYGAHFYGTNSYDAYYRLDQAPSYKLAAGMDYYAAKTGGRHILDWAHAPALPTRQTCPTALSLRSDQVAS